MTRISSLALAVACGGVLLGFAAVGAAPVVLASEGKGTQASAAPRPSQAPAAAQPSTASLARTSPLSVSQAVETRRPVRVVYVGPITAR